MKRTKTEKNVLVYKFRIYPNAAQKRQLSDALFYTRCLYNDVLLRQRRAWNESRLFLDWGELAKWLRAGRNKHTELQLLPSGTIDEIIRRARLAYEKYFKDIKAGKRVSQPRLRGRDDFSTVPYRLKDCKLTVEREGVARLKVGSITGIRVHYHRPFPADARLLDQVQVTTDHGEWYVTFQVEQRALGLLPAEGVIGVDVGLHYLVALSDGQTIEHPKWYTELLPECRVLQRKLDRQRRANNPQNFNEDGTVKKGARQWYKSNRYFDTLESHRRLHKKAARQREYFWHQITDHLTRWYNVIVIEDLDTAFMRKNPRLARLASDAALGMFQRQLEYKAKQRGVVLVKVPAAYTSQTCSVCGHTEHGNRKTQAEFVCQQCGHSQNADINAAHVIMQRGLAKMQGK